MLIVSTISLVSLFILNITVGMYYGFGIRHYWFFELLHFLGGFFTVMFLSRFLKSRISLFIGLALITLCWESLEYFITTTPGAAAFMTSNFRLENVNFDRTDTVLDIVLNFLGAVMFIYFKKSIDASSIKKPH